MAQGGRLIAVLFSFFLTLSLAAQTSDDNFREALSQVLADIQSRYGITIRYPEELVKDKWVSYARWRYRPDVDKTLASILASQDLAFAKEGDKRYKIQAFQYHLKTVEEGAAQLQQLSGFYSDKASWEKRKDSLRSCIISTLRLDGMNRAALSKPIITPVRKFKGYAVQNIAIETLPGVWVCGSLYKPEKYKGKLPLVLNPDGHFSSGRYREDCQKRCAVQALMGAMAFSYDLFGWDGESLLQVTSKDHRRSLVQSIQTWNAIRILDYFTSLRETDLSRIAVTGASGGGSQTMLLAAIDPRITLSIPVAMLSSYHSGGCPCESGMGIHLCAGGTNNVEIAAMAAPRPQLVISDGQDWTKNVPKQEFPFLQRTYGFYGVGDKLQNAHMAAEGHDYGAGKRQEAYRFLAAQWDLKTDRLKDKKGAIDEDRVTIENDNALKVFGDNGERLPANAVKGYENIVKLFESWDRSKK